MGGWIGAASWVDIVPIFLQRLPVDCILERANPMGLLLSDMEGGQGLTFTKIILDAITDRVPTEAPHLKDTIWDQDPGGVIRHLAAQSTELDPEEPQDHDLCIDRLHPEGKWRHLRHEFWDTAYKLTDPIRGESEMNKEEGQLVPFVELKAWWVFLEKTHAKYLMLLPYEYGNLLMNRA